MRELSQQEQLEIDWRKAPPLTCHLVPLVMWLKPSLTRVWARGRWWYHTEIRYWLVYWKMPSVVTARLSWWDNLFFKLFRTTASMYSFSLRIAGYSLITGEMFVRGLWQKSHSMLLSSQITRLTRWMPRQWMTINITPCFWKIYLFCLVESSRRVASEVRHRIADP